MTVNARIIPVVKIAADTQSEPHLSECVRTALKHYFAQLEGHQATGLYAMVITEVEKPLIETVLDQCGHNQSKAAQMLGLSRSTLRKKMAQYQID
jgi:Fis family transcriptional regulator